MSVGNLSEASRWLSEQLGWSCATGRELSPAQRSAVLSNEYQSLLRMGQALPPSVVMDLAALYANEDVHFASPEELAASERDQVDAYCNWMNTFATRGPLVRAMKQARLAGQPMSDGWPIPIRRELKETLPGLMTGLEAIRRLLPEFEPPPFVAQFSHNGIDQIIRGVGPAKATSPLEPALGRFFEACRSHPPIAPFQEGLLPSAATQKNSGPERLDLALLHEALAYPHLPAGLPATVRRLEPMSSSTKHRIPRAPEGNDGITRRGPPTSVLRSYLARPDFFERLSRGDVLYYRRKASTLEPQRVLLAWVVERGPQLWDRPAGTRHRRDAWGLRIVLRALEDAVRHFAGLPNVQLQPVVIFHDGQPSGPNRLGVLRPTEAEIMSQAAHPQDPAGWVPRLSGLFPAFFLREPDLEPVRAGFRGRTGFAALNALDWACVLEAAGHGRSSDSEHLFSIAQAVLIGAPERLPTAPDVRRVLARFATSVGAATISIGQDRMMASAAPGTTRARSKKNGEPYSADTVEALRKWIWNLIVARFREL